MKQTRLGRQLSAEIHKAQISQTDFSRASGISDAMTNKLLYDFNLRVGPDTLKKICAALKIYSGDIHLLIAHLRDEIQRAGYTPEKTLDIKDITKIEKSERKITLERFQEIAMDNDDLYSIIVDMLSLMGKGHANNKYPPLPQTGTLKAAETKE